MQATATRQIHPRVTAPSASVKYLLLGRLGGTVSRAHERINCLLHIPAPPRIVRASFQLKACPPLLYATTGCPRLLLQRRLDTPLPPPFSPSPRVPLPMTPSLPPPYITLPSFLYSFLCNPPSPLPPSYVTLPTSALHPLHPSFLSSSHCLTHFLLPCHAAARRQILWPFVLFSLLLFPFSPPTPAPVTQAAHSMA